MEIIKISKMYKKRPSELVGLDDPYVSFCFDEACAFIRIQIEENEKLPRFEKKYSSFSDIYKDYV